MSLVTCVDLRQELRTFADETFRRELSELGSRVRRDLREELRVFLEEITSDRGHGNSTSRTAKDAAMCAMSRVQAAARDANDDYREEEYQAGWWARELHNRGATEVPSQLGIMTHLDAESSGPILIGATTSGVKGIRHAQSHADVLTGHLALVRGIPEKQFGLLEPIAAHYTTLATFEGPVVFLADDASEAKSDSHCENSEAPQSPLHSYTLLYLNTQQSTPEQIQVTLAMMGHPVVGDIMNGGSKGREELSWSPRRFLHASQLQVRLPNTKKTFHVEVPLPTDLRRTLSNLKQLEQPQEANIMLVGPSNVTLFRQQHWPHSLVEIETVGPSVETEYYYGDAKNTVDSKLELSMEEEMVETLGDKGSCANVCPSAGCMISEQAGLDRLTQWYSDNGHPGFLELKHRRGKFPFCWTPWKESVATWTGTVDDSSIKPHGDSMLEIGMGTLGKARDQNVIAAYACKVEAEGAWCPAPKMDLKQCLLETNGKGNFCHESCSFVKMEETCDYTGFGPSDLTSQTSGESFEQTQGAYMEDFKYVCKFSLPDHKAAQLGYSGTFCLTEKDLIHGSGGARSDFKTYCPSLFETAQQELQISSPVLVKNVSLAMLREHVADWPMVTSLMDVSKYLSKLPHGMSCEGIGTFPRMETSFLEKGIKQMLEKVEVSINTEYGDKSFDDFHEFFKSKTGGNVRDFLWEEFDETMQKFGSKAVACNMFSECVWDSDVGTSGTCRKKSVGCTMNLQACQNGKEIAIRMRDGHSGPRGSGAAFIQSKLGQLRLVETSKSSKRVDDELVVLKGMGCKADHQIGLGVQPVDCVLVSTTTAVVKVDSQAFYRRSALSARHRTVKVNVISTPGSARPGKTGKDIKSPWFTFGAPGIYATSPGEEHEGGQKLFQVGKVHACNQFLQVNFHKSFATPPVVVTSTQSLSSSFHRMHAKSVEARVHSVTTDGFMLALDTVKTLPCEDTQEVVGWFAIEESKGWIGGTKFEAIKVPTDTGSDKVRLSWVGSNPQIYGTGSSGGLEVQHTTGDEVELHRDPEEEVSLLVFQERPSSSITAFKLETVTTAWHATRWSSCSSVCNQGLRTRQVKCMSSAGGGQEVPPHHCLDMQPAEEEECGSHCVWLTKKWSECAGLWPTLMKREVECRLGQHGEGNLLEDAHCGHLEKPAESRECKSHSHELAPATAATSTLQVKDTAHKVSATTSVKLAKQMLALREKRIEALALNVQKNHSAAALVQEQELLEEEETVLSHELRLLDEEAKLGMEDKATIEKEKSVLQQKADILRKEMEVLKQKKVLLEEQKQKMNFIQGAAFDDEYMEGGAEFGGDEAQYIEGSTGFDDMEISQTKTTAVDAIKKGIEDAKIELQTIKTAYKGLPSLEHKVSEEHRQKGVEKVNDGISSMSQIREIAKKRREDIQKRIKERMAEIKELASADQELLDFSKEADANLEESTNILNTIKNEEEEVRKMDERKKAEAKLTGVRAEEKATLQQAVGTVSGGTKEESVAKFMETDANAQEKGMKGRNVIHAHGTVA